MKKIILGLIVLIMLSSSAHAMTGFLESEYTDGVDKMCYYDILGTKFTLIIKLYELCPLTYTFPY